MSPAHRADWAFLGACALHQRAGLTSSLAGDAQVKRAMIESAAACAVLADATKHDMVAPYAVADLREIDLNLLVVLTSAAGYYLGVTGSLDLIDSICFTAPALYFYLKWVLLPHA